MSSRSRKYPVTTRCPLKDMTAEERAIATDFALIRSVTKACNAFLKSRGLQSHAITDGNSASLELRLLRMIEKE